MNTDRHATRKRTFLIWVISLFYIASGAMTLLTVLQIHFGTIPVSPDQLEELRRASMRWSMLGLIPAANLAGGIALLMLRRAAFYLFSGALGLNTLNMLRHVFFSSAPFHLDTGNLTGVIVGMGITLAVCIYTYRLKQADILS